MHNCAALVSLFKPPVRLKKSNTEKVAPMRGKLTIKRDKNREKEKKNSMGSRSVVICIKMSVCLCEYVLSFRLSFSFA